MDLNDDAFVDWVAQAGVRAIAFPTNWLEQGIDVWGYWAERNQTGAALVAANSYGKDGGIRFCGRSVVLDGDVVMAAAPPTGDGYLRASLPRR